MNTLKASFSVSVIDPNFDDWGVTNPATISVAVTVEYIEIDGSIVPHDTSLDAAGFTEAELKNLVSESAIIEGILNAECEQLSAKNRAIPGVQDMLAVTGMHGTVTDEEAFKAAAKKAYEALGSTREIFIAVTAAQTSDLRLDDKYFDQIKGAI